MFFNGNDAGMSSLILIVGGKRMQVSSVSQEQFGGKAK